MRGLEIMLSRKTVFFFFFLSVREKYCFFTPRSLWETNRLSIHLAGLFFLPLTFLAWSHFFHMSTHTHTCLCEYVHYSQNKMESCVSLFLLKNHVRAPSVCFKYRHYNTADVICVKTNQTVERTEGGTEGRRKGEELS